MYSFTPVPGYAYTTKLGDRNLSVAALQLNLAVTVDGDFGPNTETAVKAVQSKHRLLVDGIAGPVTQQTLCRELMGPAHEQYKTPTGLLRGICENESGFILAAYAAHPSGGGFDIGPFQDAFPPRAASQANYAAAYSAAKMALDTAANARQAKDAYRTEPFAASDKRAWQLAALTHNWPFAAANLAKTGHIYPDDPARDDQFAQWISDATAGRLTTPTQWCENYIAKTTKYVTDFTP